MHIICGKEYRALAELKTMLYINYHIVFTADVMETNELGALAKCSASSPSPQC